MKRRPILNNRFLTLAISVVLLLPALWLYVFYRVDPEFNRDKFGVAFAVRPVKNSAIHQFYKHPERHYDRFNIYGSAAGNQENLLLAKQKISELAYSKDTLKGVCLMFSPKTDYQSFIDVIDMCFQEKPGMFCFEDDGVWVFNQSESAVDRYIKSIREEGKLQSLH